MQPMPGCLIIFLLILVALHWLEPGPASTLWRQVSEYELGNGAG